MPLAPIDKIFDSKDRNIKGLHFGIVVDNKDPEQIGRIKVKIPTIFECEDADISALPWVRPGNVIGNTPDNTSLNIPKIGTQIYVEFHEDDPDTGVYAHSLISKSTIPEPLKEDYPNTQGKTWAGEGGLPSWLKINTSKDLVEIFLNPSKTILRFDKEGHVEISTQNDISLFTTQSINFKADKALNFKAKDIVMSSENFITKSNKAKFNFQDYSISALRTQADLGAYIKKTISEVYTTASFGGVIPQFVIQGVINATGALLGTINGTPVQGLFTGTPATYAGGTYTPSPVTPGVIVPDTGSEVIALESKISSIDEIIKSYVTDYQVTAQYMQNQSTELRKKFRDMASKWVGNKDYEQRKELPNYEDMLKTAEEVVVLEDSVAKLQDKDLKLQSVQIEAAASAAQLTAKAASETAEIHSELSDGFTQESDYKELFTELDPSVQAEVLDTFNQSAPEELKLPSPTGGSFQSMAPDALGDFLNSVPPETFFPVVTGTFFNFNTFNTMSLWGKTNILTTTVNNKQKNQSPSWTQQKKDQFNTVIQKVRQIEILSCKIYELYRMIENLIKSIADLRFNLNKFLDALRDIKVYLPTWILDLIKQLLDGIMAGDLPKYCVVGSVSPEELETMPDDISALLGKQNTIAAKGYQYQKEYSSIVKSITPTTNYLQSVTAWATS